MEGTQPTSTEHDIQGHTPAKELFWYKTLLAIGLTLGVVFTLLEIFNSAPIAERGFFATIALGGFAIAMAFYPVIQGAKNNLPTSSAKQEVERV